MSAKVKKSIKIVKFFSYLDVKDTGHKGDSSVFDVGTAAIYNLLFKIMGDKRSYKELWELDHPPATELSHAAETGSYDLITQVADDHGCQLEENDANLEINDEVIDKLESLMPKLTNQIENNLNNINSYDLNKILKEK